MTRPLPAALAALLLLLPLTARADDAPAAPPETGERFEDRARRALELFADDITDLLRDLGEGLDRLDDYGPPQVLPNGDILIPRKRPPAPEPDDAPVDL